MRDFGGRHDPFFALLLAFGLAAFLLAGLSIVDMFLPRPYDGVMLEADAPGQLRVRQVVPGSGADQAGIRPGDRILGIDRNMVRGPVEAAEMLAQREIGALIPYFIRTAGGVEEVYVELGPRRMGDPSYLYACTLGLAFFLVGLFVLLRQPQLRASQVFFLLANLFMLFLICRLRPASYSRVDSFILATGTGALLLLPATFLHFFLIFPHPLWARWRKVVSAEGFRRTVRTSLLAVYLLPPLVLLATLLVHRGRLDALPLISGAPVANWWVLAAYMLLGLTALAVNAARLEEPRERRGALLVLTGSLFGLVPFLVLAVAFPSLLHTEKFLFYGVIPLGLVPLTFAYAIVRFQLLQIRILLKKSLLYTLTTALVTGFYALGIALFNGATRGTALANSPYFPIVFALAIVLLFEPLRQRLQKPVDRFFFAERARLQQAMVEMGEAFTAQPDPALVVRELVEKIPRLLGLHFAALYLLRGGRLERVEGPAVLPPDLPLMPTVHEALQTRDSLTPVEDLLGIGRRSPEAGEVLARLAGAGVEVVADLASPRRWIGLVLLSGKTGQMVFEKEELNLLRGLLHQASIALETSLLLEERTRQAELERELEIAASIQRSLLPAAVRLAPGWSVAAVCRPARHVGGDFIAELPRPADGTHAVAYGDVSGKSVSGALVMMAAFEVLNSLALTAADPEELLRLANQRLYRLANKSFVALGYFAANGSGLHYLLAGQPEPLKRGLDGRVEELPLPEHRLPLGALTTGTYKLLHTPVAPGELVLGYSDGVVEACSPTGEFFGSERLVRILESSSPEPDEVIARVLDAVDQFTHGHEPYDDLTLVAIRRRQEVAP